MALRITISIPEELHQKMQKWKDSFNYSGIFQEAVRNKIEAKERFKNHIKEDTDMEQIIERLKAEKQEIEGNLYEAGKVDGLDWAKNASYKDLQYALQHAPMNEIQENVISYNPGHDEVLGDYFSDVLEENEEMDFIESAPGNYLPNGAFASWEEGWIAGVREFWEEVEDKIQ